MLFFSVERIEILLNSDRPISSITNCAAFTCRFKLAGAIIHNRQWAAICVNVNDKISCIQLNSSNHVGQRTFMWQNRDLFADDCEIPRQCY